MVRPTRARATSTKRCVLLSDTKIYQAAGGVRRDDSPVSRTGGAVVLSTEYVPEISSRPGRGDRGDHRASPCPARMCETQQESVTADGAGGAVMGIKVKPVRPSQITAVAGASVSVYTRPSPQPVAPPPQPAGQRPRPAPRQPVISARDLEHAAVPRSNQAVGAVH
jgi:hypothetical protein